MSTINPIYNIKPNGKSGYLVSLPIMSNTRRIEITKYIKSNYISRDSEIYTDTVLFSEAQIKSFISQIKSIISASSLNSHSYMKYLNNITKPDSASIIQISFDDRSIDMNSKLEYIYFWNYSNFRFLVPLLPFFNEKHKRNQCVNRAIEACFKNKMDGVLIYPTLNHFKLYKNQ